MPVSHLAACVKTANLLSSNAAETVAPQPVQTYWNDWSVSGVSCLPNDRMSPAEVDLAKWAKLGQV